MEFITDASYFSIHRDTWSLHFAVKKDFWVWGYAREGNNHPINCYGIGPLVLLAIDL